MKLCSRALAVYFSAICSNLLAATEPTQQLPNYRPVPGLSGTLSSIGSDTLASVMILWAESFQRGYPAVRIQIQGAGSATAPPALIAGSADFGPMSRPMKESEIEAFERRHGYPPTALVVAIDAIAIFVHQDNPIAGLTLAQLDAIFSRTRICGSAQAIALWGDLDLEGRWADQRIQLFGRNSVSGTYGYFKQRALCKGDFRASVNQQPGSGSVVQAIGQSPAAIGYAGAGYRTPHVRMLPLASQPGQNFVAANHDTITSGDYPLRRLIYIYVNQPPGRALPLLAQEFLRLVLSKQGQAIAAKAGYVPLPGPLAARQRALLAPRR